MIEPVLLHGYADGDGSAEERARLEAELKSCLESQAELRAIQGMKALLATRPALAEPECRECWSVCRERLRAVESARRTERFVGRYAWAMAAGVLGLIVVTGVVRRGQAPASMAGADLARIMSQIGPGSSGRTSFQSAAEQDRAEAMLRRARLVVDPMALRVTAVNEFLNDGMVIRRFLLRDGEGPMALLDLPTDVRVDGLRPMPGTNLMAGTMDQMQCVEWTTGTRQFMLVGPRSAESLARVAEAIHQTP